MDSETLVRTARAFLSEQKRWGMRVNDLEDKPFEVFRCSDDDFNGSFSEIHSYRYRRDAEVMLEEKQLTAASKAFIKALIE
jgi:hypothetical protein